MFISNKMYAFRRTLDSSLITGHRNTGQTRHLLAMPRDGELLVVNKVDGGGN